MPNEKPEVYHHKSDNPSSDNLPDEKALSEADARRYWRANLRLLFILLAVWFLVSFGFGILFLEPLNKISFFGYKLGFWWAQQGSIYAFVILIFVYVYCIKKIDRRYGMGDS